MDDQGTTPDQQDASPRTLLLVTAGSLTLGTLIVLGAILPAEYDLDPLGLGRLSGLSRLWAPDEKEWREGTVKPSYTADAAIERHTIEIPLGAASWPEAALEYKVAMSPGQTLLYSWTATHQDGTPVSTPIEYDFHGHTVEDGKTMTVADYSKSSGVSATGALTAPFEGIHGWYFRNHEEDPVIIRLRVEGFFKLIDPGQPGNEFNIRPLD
jgi:hypothetical protein